MSEIGDILFGESEPGTPGQVVDPTPEEFKALRPKVASGVEELFGGGPQFGGPFAAPLGANEQALLERIQGLAGGGGPARGAANDLLTKTLQGGFLSPESNPFLQQTVNAATRPILEGFRDITLPQLQGAFTRAGQFIQPGGSSPFDKAAAIAGRSALNAVGDVSANIFGQNFQQERGRQQEALTLPSSLQREELNQAISGLQAQALPRLIEQRGIEGGLREFQRRIELMLNALTLGGTLSSQPSVMIPPTPGSSSEGIAGSLISAAPSFFMTPAGGASAAATIGSFFSSRALKDAGPEADTDALLEAVESLEVGQWNYKGDPTPHVGPYAEDFREATGLGDGVTINVADALGVLTGAVKALTKRVRELEGRRNG